jgi:UDP-N-acetyl-D-glucosamine dehydrogenase
MQPISRTDADLTPTQTHVSGLSWLESYDDRSLALPTVAVVGLGYVGLPTGLALASAGFGIIAIDLNDLRLRDIRLGKVDLLPRDHERLAGLDRSRFRLTSEAAAVAAADVVLVCVPTPVNDDYTPDLRARWPRSPDSLRALRGACRGIVANARAGQTIILTSTSYVGTTRELLAEPLAERGLEVGKDIWVAFSPERIDPGNRRHDQEEVPRVLGGATEACMRSAAAVLSRITSQVHLVSSMEAAEFTKLYENTFRAVNIAFAYEMANASKEFGLDPIEVTEAAATKPYGFLPFYPSAGVGGHCIPCDPHYLLTPLAERGVDAPFTQTAMRDIAQRPRRVAARAEEILRDAGIDIDGARMLVVGVAYKPGIQDVRESPALEIIEALHERGAGVCYHDPLVDQVTLGRQVLQSVPAPAPEDYDLVVVVTAHPNSDYGWLSDCARVLDGTYRLPAGLHRFTV